MEYRIALQIATLIQKSLRFKIDTGKIVKFKNIIVGSVRRKNDIVSDIDIMIVVPETLFNVNFFPSIVIDNKFKITKIHTSGTQTTSMDVKYRSFTFQLDIFKTIAKCYPFSLLHYTGSKTNNISMRRHAKDMGYMLNQWGIFKNKQFVGKDLKTEKDIYDFLELSYKTPANRI